MGKIKAILLCSLFLLALAYAGPKIGYIIEQFKVFNPSSLNDDACASGVYGGYEFFLVNTGEKEVDLINVQVNGASKTFCHKSGPLAYEIGKVHFGPGEEKSIRVQEGYLYCKQGQEVFIDTGLVYTGDYLNKYEQSEPLSFECTLVPPPPPRDR